MSGAVIAASAQPSHSVFSPIRAPPTVNRPRCSVNPRASSRDRSSSLKLISFGLQKSPGISWRCNSTAGDSGENESRTVLDAFFLGKAVAEALNERIESAVGEFLSTIGRLQAEQQKQVQEFQEEVLEKARKAKAEAAREAMEAQGLILKPTPIEVPAVNGVASKADSLNPSLESKPTIEQDPANED